MATAKTTKTTKAPKAKPCTKKCEPTDTCKAECPKEAKKVDVGEIKDKVVNTAKKIPQWLARAKKELEALIEKLNKLDAYLAKILEAFGGQVTWDNVRRVRGTRDERTAVTLLMKQRQAMAAYKEALQARIDIAEKGIALKVQA
jgi:hypothetical protein